MNKQAVVQFEITGKDPIALHHFYASLFGWDLQETPGGHTSSYRRTSAAETGLPGAIGPTRSGPNADREDPWDGGSGQVTVYVEVADLPESLSAAQRLGGSVVAPIHELRGRELRVAFIADPEGHVVGLSQGLRQAIEQAGYAASATPSTPTEREGLTLSDNIEIITRFEYAFRAADQATIDELCDPRLVDHNPAPDEEPTLAGFKQKVAGFKAIFPDLEEDLQDIVASGDTVATRWVVTGSQQQEFMGIPASGQTIRVEGMNFYRLKDGRVTDLWTQFDGVAMMQQLGALPA